MISSVSYSPSKSLFKAVTSKTFTGNNTTVAVPLFRITGTVKVTKIYGIVTTVLGSNHTGAYFRLNDQTAQIDITLQTVGVTLSSFEAGSIVSKTALSATLASIRRANAGAFVEAAAANAEPFSPFVVQKKSGANTDIEYVYTTTNTPTSGVIQFFCEYEAISADGAVTAQ